MLRLGRSLSVCSFWVGGMKWCFTMAVVGVVPVLKVLLFPALPQTATACGPCSSSYQQPYPPIYSWLSDTNTVLVFTVR